MNPTGATSAPSSDPSSGPSPERLSRSDRGPSAWALWVGRVFPLVMAALFFNSVFFAILAPTPIVLARGWRAPGALWLAAVCNTLLCAWLGGWTGAAAFAAWVAIPTVVFVSAFDRGRNLERAALFAWCASVVAVVVLGWALLRSQSAAISDLRVALSDTLSQLLAQMSSSQRERVVGGISAIEGGGQASTEQIVAGVLRILPSGAAIVSLLMVWVAAVTTLRLNPQLIATRAGVSRAVLARWKTPEWLVWPTLVFGATLVIPIGGGQGAWWVQAVGENGFRTLMALYALQGLSVITYFLERFRVGGLLRSLAYASALFLLLPVLLGLGFFDLWFDFRGRIRQT